MSKELICSQCGYVGNTKSDTPGNILIEILMYFFFIIPGLIYSIWRLSARKRVCGSCGSPNLIPVDSPMGRKLGGNN
jgi:hypothetical protein